MKRISMILMAFALVLTMTQCKKNEETNQNEIVTSSLDVKYNNGSKVDVNTITGTVNFETGDKVYVGSGGKYVGFLTHNGINFVGNCEPRDVMSGDYDVLVCDGFVGNVVLKTSESLAHAIGYFLKKECFKGMWRILGAVLLKGAFKSMKQQLDPDIYGGAPLLGVPGAVIITHGSSSHKAIYHAVRVGANAARNDVTGMIARAIEEYESSREIL